MNEELDDILSRPPRPLLRWGITVLCGISLLMLTGSWFIRYPEVIKGTVILSTEKLPMHVNKLTIGSLSNEHFAGRAIFSLSYISKLQVGQQVLIRLDAFPYQEYGVWHGVVRELALAEDQSQCQAIITLTDSFRLDQLMYRLPFRPHLTGNVELITNDLRLIERLAYGLVNR